jgi:hypothetical protein
MECCKEGVQTTPCWNIPVVLECEQLYADAHCHWGTLHRMSAFHAFCAEWPYSGFFFFGVSRTLLTLLWSLVAWIPPSALLSCHRKQWSSAFWRGLFGDVRASTAFTAFWFQHSQMKARFYHILLLRCDEKFIAIFVWYRSKKSKPKPFSAFCA